MQVFPVDAASVCDGVVLHRNRGGAASIETRTAGAVESMEGAAIAHVAHLHGIPVGEVRGISNIVTDRDTKPGK